MSWEVRMGESENIPQNAGFWWKLVHLNPALWRGLIVAVAALLVSVGISIFTDSVQNGVYGVIIAVVGIVQALWTRGSVTANQKVVVYKPDPVESPNTLASGLSISYDEDALVRTAANTDDTVVANS
jgi:hypothetical protein